MDYSTKTVSLPTFSCLDSATLLTDCSVDNGEGPVFGVSAAVPATWQWQWLFGLEFLLSRVSVLSGSSFSVAFVSSKLKMLPKLTCLIASFCLSGRELLLLASDYFAVGPLFVIFSRETVPSQTSDMGKEIVSVLAHTFLLP